MNLNHFVLSQKSVGKTRRDIANIISQAIGMEVKFTGVPKMLYLIGAWKIERDGTIKTPELDFGNLNELKTVINAINRESIEFEGALTIEISDDELSDSQQTNLKNVLLRKKALIKKALASDFEILFDDNIQFSGFNPTGNLAVLKAYIHLVKKLIEHARNICKASPKSKPVENEKYEFRCFLLRLGFVGDEYKEDRRILLQNLSGNAAFKSEYPKRNDDLAGSEVAP